MAHRTASYYDNRSNLTCVLDPDNGLTYYEYDAGNRMTSVKNPFGEVTYYEYTVGGQVKKRTLGNGTITYYEYDAIGQVKKVDDRKSDMSLICSFEYERDEVGNPTSIVWGNGALTYYDYDAGHQLTGERQFDTQGQEIHSYEWEYDAAGNRTHQLHNGTHTYYTCNEANELTQETEDGATIYYSYDHCGNSTARQEAGGTTYYHYDHENLMTRMDFPGGGHSYYNYDADGKRVGIHPRGSVRKEFIYQGPDMLKLLLDRDAEGETLAHYTMGNGLESVRQEAESSFYHYDALGSTYRLTDAVENVTDTYRYNAWGEILGTTGETFNRHTFVGRERYSMSRNSAYALLGLRYYVPKVGRFWTSDREVVGENWYLYSRNIPSNRFDATGLLDVSLTFDDGPTKVSQYILDSLRRHKAPRVGFFWVGTRMETGLGRQLARRAITEGHLIANHSYTHDLISWPVNKLYTLPHPSLVQNEICLWEDAYWQATDQFYGPKKYWRAPAWDYDPRVAQVFAVFGYARHCGADLSSRDAVQEWGSFVWEPQPAKRLAFCVLKYLKEHRRTLRKGRPVVIGWHDKPDVAPHTRDAIEIFLTQTDKDPSVAVKPYQPTGGPAGAPARMEYKWLIENCKIRDPW